MRPDHLQLPRHQLHALLDRPATTIYKEDRRTRVFSVEDGGRRWVVKVFQHRRWWQALRWAVRCHPAQREARRVRQLQALGLPVTPIVGCAMRWCPTGGVGFLVCPYVGESLFRQIKRNTIGSASCRRTLIEKLAQLTADLLDRKLVHRDYKASNILIDDRGELWLIDTDRIARSAASSSRMRMLAALDETARRAGATRTQRLRFIKALLTRAKLGDVRTVAQSLR